MLDEAFVELGARVRQTLHETSDEMRDCQSDHEAGTRAQSDSLLREARDDGAFVIYAVQRVDERVPCRVHAGDVLRVADFVECEQEVEEIAARAQRLQVSICVRVGAEERAIRAGES